jgi:hypothetical protein
VTGLPESWADGETWHAVITRAGWCTWDAHIERGLMMRRAALVIGTRRHAERVARRRLARARRQDARESDRTVIS